MAREARTRKAEDKVVIVEAAPQRRSSRLSDGAAPKSYRYVFNKQAPSSSVQRPAREARITKNASKAPKTKGKVSISGVFRKTQKVKNGRVSKKVQKRREVTPELDFIADLQDGINEARMHISTNAKTTFTSIHNTLNSKLQAIHGEDAQFMMHVSETAATLSTPLLGEKIETNIKRDGHSVTEIVEIGKRVEAFKALIEKEEAKLKQAWQEWDAVQEEYIALGADVFGAELFDTQESERNYKKELELLELEHNTRVEELQEEIEGIGADALEQMKKSEKELDAATRREQARLLQQLL